MTRFTRRRFCQRSASLTVASSLLGIRSADSQPAAQPKSPGEPKDDGLDWYDVEDWGIEGRGWPAKAMAHYYDRLPAKAEGIVRDTVWNLSRHSAGMLTHFDTDATAISVRYSLLNKNLAMAHMPATGVSGIDLYARDENGHPRWVSVFRPTGGADQGGSLVSGIDPGKRRFTAYLPLYNGVNKLEFGVPRGSYFEGVGPRPDKPVVYYGTSITHGACASRPGMPHPAILERRLGKPGINLGFSGNGKMELEVAALLGEIDASAYVIDCLPNVSAEIVAANTGPLVRLLRTLRPDTPIVLVEDRTYASAWIKQSSRERHRDSRAALVRAYDALIKGGARDLYYVSGDDLLGDDDEATTDGSHPNDLGFMRQADAIEPVLREALGLPAAEA